MMMVTAFPIRTVSPTTTPSRFRSGQPAQRHPCGILFSVLSKDHHMNDDCNTAPAAAATTPTTSELNWISLTEDGGVRKAVLSRRQQQQVGGEGVPTDDGSQENYDNDHDALLLPLVDGSSVVISYQGRWVDAHWSTQDVVECWLLQQQGMTRNDPLYQAFQDFEIDESKLTNKTDGFLFTEDFVQHTLGVTSKMACKKLVMAARRLKTVREETRAGTVFDQNDYYVVTVAGASNKKKDNTKSKTLIQGMRIALATMSLGEVSNIQIRSDYAYGAEGYRRLTGEVMVPPFCTLEFRVNVKSIVTLS